jgi:hypothetical protein
MINSRELTSFPVLLLPRNSSGVATREKMRVSTFSSGKATNIDSRELKRILGSFLSGKMRGWFLIKWARSVSTLPPDDVRARIRAQPEFGFMCISLHGFYTVLAEVRWTHPLFIRILQ